MNNIPTFIIHQEKRLDRYVHITKEFSNRREFHISIIQPIHDDKSNVSLWRTICSIVEDNKHEKFILICEDDHAFQTCYSSELLFSYINESIDKAADVLCGGVSWFEDAINVSENLFWVKKFSGLQFTIFFQPFYNTILTSEFKEYDAADYKISCLSQNKFFIHPFISCQKEFGYSDVTAKNDNTNRVEALFTDSQGNASALKEVGAFYEKRIIPPNFGYDYTSIMIPTYIINLKERIDRRLHILQEFANKPEFDVRVVDAIKHKTGAVGLWQTIRKCVESGIENDDDLIIVCEDDHKFTEHYDRDIFIQNILEAHEQGCDILSGGIGGFYHAVPITKQRYWIDYFWCTQFIVLFRKFFNKILSAPYDDKVTADDKISAITTHKMVLYPFISIQHDFGYSDVTRHNNDIPGNITQFFKEADKKLSGYKCVYEQLIEQPK